MKIAQKIGNLYVVDTIGEGPKFAYDHSGFLISFLRLAVLCLPGLLANIIHLNIWGLAALAIVPVFVLTSIWNRMCFKSRAIGVLKALIVSVPLCLMILKQLP